MGTGVASLNKNWMSLIKPTRVDVVPDNFDHNLAKVVIEPLERGYGQTLGNALRRILLSSLQGAAIVAVKIPGVVHEFASVPGVKEDMTDIVLSIKGVKIRMTSGSLKTVTLSAQGPCIVTAGMIQTSAGIDVLNKDHVICTLADGYSLNIDLLCATGKGYVPASASNEHDQDIGWIYIDALYSPVEKVSYKVDHARVGQMTDYDKLTMFVQTNGAITPELAVALAARIAQDQFQVFVTFQDVEEEIIQKMDELSFAPVLLKKVDELELSVRSQNCLKNDNIVYIGDLVIKTESEMLKTPNFGRKSLNEIKEILSKFDLKFGMVVPGWPPENLAELAKKYEEPY